MTVPPFLVLSGGLSDAQFDADKLTDFAAIIDGLHTALRDQGESHFVRGEVFCC